MLYAGGGEKVCGPMAHFHYDRRHYSSAREGEERDSSGSSVSCRWVSVRGPSVLFSRRLGWLAVIIC
jgi:hypothetical protein